ncbi:MAG TPA: TRAP transporter substrate-binding protein [Burkholderiales bacterium]|nr:TRAP transporter substrate-binding protein [Burkholderiales bacterium]
MKTALAALAILCAATSAQAQTKWRLAGNFATEHSSSVAMSQFRDELAKASGGQLTVDVFPAMQLGGAAENVQNVRAGTLQMIWVGMAFLSRTVPELEAISLPFQFESREQAFRVVDGPVGKLFDAKFADKGLIDLGFMELGARHVTNSKRPIKSVEDLKGLKIRMQPNETHLATFRALGANPVAMDIKELYSALQQGVVDGQENPFSVIRASRYFEVQKFVSNTGHFFDFINVVANRRAFEALPAAQQKALRDSMRKAVAWQRDRAKAEENESIAEIKQRGMTFDEVSPQFREQMRKGSANVVEDVKKRVGADFVNRVIAETKK